MEVMIDYRPLWAVLISLIAAGLIMLSKKNPNIRESWTVLAAVGKTIIVFSMLPTVLSGTVIETAPIEIAKGISLYFKADTFGMIFASLSSFLWIITSVYSIGYMREDIHVAKHLTGYFASFAVSLSAAIGIAFAGNLLTFFIFFELLTLSTYPLVIHRRDGDAIKAGRKYLAYTVIAGQVMLIGIIWAYVVSGTMDFTPGGFMAGTAPDNILRIIFILMIIGASAKAAVMPLHEWLPDAMNAPTPVSALLHAVAVVKAGAFGVIRVVGYVFGCDLLAGMGVAEVLAWFAAATIIISSLIAMRQDNLKRRLAFSTVGQLSYCVLGAAMMTPIGLLGGMFHIVAHAFMKITLFFCAGAIHITTHKDYVSEMKGIGKQMPITMAAFTIASLGIAGMPFMVGFVSKWNLAQGALEGGHGIYIAVLIASALLSMTYLLPIGYMAFFKKNDEFKEFGEARIDILIPIVICTVIVLILGVAPNAGVNFYDLASMSTQQMLEAAKTTTESIVGGGL